MEQREVDNNGHIFLLPTTQHHTFPSVNQEVQLLCKGPMGNVGSDRRGDGGGKSFLAQPPICYIPFWLLCPVLLRKSLVSLCKGTELDKYLFKWKM